ncbi:FAD-binding protein [Novosphingobium panipatense]
MEHLDVRRSLPQAQPRARSAAKGPFHAVRLERMGGTAISSSGILTDMHGQALDWNDAPIPGLYVAGNSQARMETGAVMQSGISNARGMTYGWLAAQHAAGRPSDRLAREAERMGL